MVKIDYLLRSGKIGRINELELGRYINFFEHSYKDNIEHSKAVIKTFPRWSIISGYYAMHDITKMLFAAQYRLAVNYNVHETAILLLKILTEDRELLKLAEKGYKEFLSLANDLAQAKKDRVKAQYYTGTGYMKEQYRKMSQDFLKTTAEPYIGQMQRLAGGKK